MTGCRSGVVVELPSGPFDVVYADPPWHYNDRLQLTGEPGDWKPTGGAEKHYPVMTIEELCAVDVKAICAPEAILFMWTTGPQMELCMPVLRAWGFKYKTVAFVWSKQRVNPGAYTMSECEFVLAATRKSIPKPRGLRNVKQFVSAPRTKHSEKPEEVAHRIRLMFPTQRKVELFARRPREGWTCWGNEVANAA
jgi:N6-adenosine-specific RNA methylase IME4